MPKILAGFCRGKSDRKPDICQIPTFFFASHDETFASHDETFASHDETFANHDVTFAND
jgi:hypothetical protein